MKNAKKKLYNKLKKCQEKAAVIISLKIKEKKKARCNNKLKNATKKPATMISLKMLEKARYISLEML